MYKKILFLLSVLILLVSSVNFATALPDYNVHNITSDKTLYLRDGITHESFNETKGHCIVSWKDQTRYGFFNAIMYAPNGSEYEFQLIRVESCNDDYIEGYFSIARNGILVEPNIHGKLYGIDSSLGEYFKFYSDNMNWHMSAYITYRFDY